MGSVAGKHDQATVEDETGNGSDEELKKPVPDTTEAVSNTADARVLRMEMFQLIRIIKRDSLLSRLFLVRRISQCE